MDRKKEWDRRSNMKRRGFYLAEDEYNGKVRMQDGECVICGCNNNGKTLHTDHNHDTKQVRDLLCRACNHVLGLMEEDPDRLRAAADYLEDHEQRAA